MYILKPLVVASMLLWASFSIAQNEFSGVINSVQTEGETIVISDLEYKVGRELVVFVNGRKINFDDLEPGFNVRYTLAFNQVGGKRVIRVDLIASAELENRLLNH